MILTEIPIGREAIPFIVQAIKEFDNLNNSTIIKDTNFVKVNLKSHPCVFIIIKFQCQLNMFPHREVLIDDSDDDYCDSIYGYPYLNMDELREAIKKHIESYSSTEYDDQTKLLEEDKAKYY